MNPSNHYAIKMHKYFASCSPFKEYKTHNNKVLCLGWSCDGSKLAAGSSDKVINLFYLDNSNLTRSSTLKGHSSSVDQVLWHPHDSHVAASTGNDGTIKLWDTRTSSKLAGSLQLRGENINLAWHPRGHVIAVGNKEDLVSCIDLRHMPSSSSLSSTSSVSNSEAATAAAVFHSEQFKCEINEFAWSPGAGDLFVMTTGAGSLYLYSYPELRREHEIRAHSTNAICIRFDGVGARFAVGSADAIVSVWDARQLVCTHSVARLEWPVRTLGFSHDAHLLACGSEDHHIDISCAATGQLVHRLPTHSSLTYMLAWNPRAHILAFSTDEKPPPPPSFSAAAGSSLGGGGGVGSASMGSISGSSLSGGVTSLHQSHHPHQQQFGSGGSGGGDLSGSGIVKLFGVVGGAESGNPSNGNTASSTTTRIAHSHSLRS